jgi:protein O-mannosyl-transferase
VASGIVAYGRTFSVPLLFDDFDAILRNPTIRHWGTVLSPPGNTTAGGRPVLNASLAINYAISGTAVWSYHAVNLAIHVLCGLTLFGIIRRALASLRNPSATLIAFSASLIWILHPLQTESVTYTIQRAESLMGLFYLLTLYLFIRGAESDGRGLPWFILCFVTCAFGMATKEVMVSAPLIVFLYDRTFIARSFSEAWRRRWRVYAGLGSTWILLAFLVLSMNGRGASVGMGSGISSWSYALTQSSAIVHYLRLCFFPHPLVLDYGGLLEVRAAVLLPCVLVAVFLLAATVWALATHPAMGFLGTCFFAVLAPSSSFIPIVTETIAEHRMYLPLASVVVLAVLGIYRWLGRAAPAACIVLSAVLAVVTWQRNGIYLSEEGILRDSVDSRPENPRAHNNLGFKLATIPGRMDEAIAQYRAALSLNPGYAIAHNNLGVALLTRPGGINEAISHFEEAVRIQPNYAEAHCNLGNALRSIPGHANQAAVQYREAIRLKPDYAAAHNNLGNALAMDPERRDEAMAEYGEAVRLDPDMAAAHANLGSELAQIPGRLDDAIVQYEEALRLEPDSVDTHINLGVAFAQSPGRMNDAIVQFEEASRLEPSSVEAHNDLGRAYSEMPGRLNDAIIQYREAVRLRPDSPQGWHHLGVCLFNSGNLPAAAQAFRAELQLSPNSAAGQQALAAVLRQEDEAH